MEYHYISEFSKKEFETQLLDSNIIQIICYNINNETYTPFIQEF